MHAHLLLTPSSSFLPQFKKNIEKANSPIFRRNRRKRRYVNGQHEPLIKEKYERYEQTRGEFEDGYARGYRAGRGGRREDYYGRDEAFRVSRRGNNAKTSISHILPRRAMPRDCAILATVA